LSALTTGVYENLERIEKTALTVLENCSESVVQFSPDDAPGLVCAVYAVLTNVLPNRWREHYREVLAPPLELRRVS
jgi:hypothetical protein